MSQDVNSQILPHCSSFSKSGTEIAQTSGSCCMPEFCASNILAFIMSVELFDYVVDGRNLWEPCFGEGGGFQTGDMASRLGGIKCSGHHVSQWCILFQRYFNSSGPLAGFLCSFHLTSALHLVSSIKREPQKQSQSFLSFKGNKDFIFLFFHLITAVIPSLMDLFEQSFDVISLSSNLV